MSRSETGGRSALVVRAGTPIARAVTARLSADGFRVHADRGGLRTPNERRRAVAAAATELGAIDVLVVPPPGKAHPSTTPRSVDEALRDAYFTVQESGRTMTDGHIVLVCRPRGPEARGRAPISLLEGAFTALTRLLAVELAPRNIALNSLCPIADDADPGAIAGAVAFLVSERASYMTGALLPIGPIATAGGGPLSDRRRPVARGGGKG